MANNTALYQAHIDMGAKMVDFSGWNMPLHYGSQRQEHDQVRSKAGMFDVSHMTLVDVTGAEAKQYLRYLLANDVDKLRQQGKALYSAMLNPQAGVKDDLIVYLMSAPDQPQPWYRLVVNCATRVKDLEWLQQQAQDFQVTLTERPEFAMVAVQGPEAIALTQQALGADKATLVDPLTIFQGVALDDWFVARTGYTGEEGYEIILPANQATEFWQQLADLGVAACGLGARDSLRLEAGMNLYGQEMDEQINPLLANMGWTLAWQPEERDFIGRTALLAAKQAGQSEKLVGLILEGRGILRAGQQVQTSAGTGIITSGGFSPSLDCSIALARVPVDIGAEAQVDIRGRWVDVQVGKPVFVRNGAKVFS